jgi:hypothetical protein
MSLHTTFGGISFLTLEEAASYQLSRDPKEAAGLYSQEQFKKFANNLYSVLPGGNFPLDNMLTTDQVNTAIDRSRKPTIYEAMNYMPPICAKDTDNEKLDSIPTAPPCKMENGVYVGTDYQLFAPLYGNETLYVNLEKAKSMVLDYLLVNKPSITTYISAMKDVAIEVQKAAIATKGGKDLGQAASDTIYTLNKTDETQCIAGQEMSIAGKIYHFFLGEGTSMAPTCGIIALKNAVIEYWTEKSQNDPNNPNRAVMFPNYFLAKYTAPDEPNPFFMTGFMPGPRQGATDEGNVRTNHLLTSGDLLAKRNYYSTKLMPISKVAGGGGELAPPHDIMYNESETADIDPIADIAKSAENMLSPQAMEELKEFGELDH